MKKYALILALVLSGCGQGHVGPAGSNGQAGQKGDTGEAGPIGAPGTSITVVKLCPGVTVYPSKFVEVAFCIGDALYGTYSANDGFSSELPPGTYLSNGINASCNVTIGAHCAVTN
jgi:hypothetical protein